MIKDEVMYVSLEVENAEKTHKQNLILGFATVSTILLDSQRIHQKKTVTSRRRNS
jgi:hypothetical protein